jgi:hypothetical protein
MVGFMLGKYSSQLSSSKLFSGVCNSPQHCGDCALLIRYPGFPVCFGVFQEHYSHVPAFANQNVALIGTVAQGIGYLGAPASMALTKQFPKYQRHFIWVGWVLCIVALGTGSLTTRLGGLVATQGLMYGVGFQTLYWPIMSMVNEWWITRKGFAFGLIIGAAGMLHISASISSTQTDE